MEVWSGRVTAKHDSRPLQVEHIAEQFENDLERRSCKLRPTSSDVLSVANSIVKIGEVPELG